MGNVNYSSFFLNYSDYYMMMIDHRNNNINIIENHHQISRRKLTVKREQTDTRVIKGSVVSFGYTES